MTSRALQEQLTYKCLKLLLQYSPSYIFAVPDHTFDAGQIKSDILDCFASREGALRRSCPENILQN